MDFPPLSPQQLTPGEKKQETEVEPSAELLLFSPDHVPGLLRELRHLVPRQQQHVPGAARVLHEWQQHDRKPDLYLRLPGTGSADTDTASHTSATLFFPMIHRGVELNAEHPRHIQGVLLVCIIWGGGRNQR